jgi:hypothetical protein
MEVGDSRSRRIEHGLPITDSPPQARHRGRRVPSNGGSRGDNLYEKKGDLPHAPSKQRA